MDSILSTLETCFMRSVAVNNIYSVVFLVGSANNASQQYPAYIDRLAEKGKTVNKTVLVFIVDPVLEEVPLFVANLDKPHHTKQEMCDQHMVNNLRFLSFRTSLYVTPQGHEEHMPLLNKIVETCMDKNIIFLYSAFTGVDSYVLQDHMHSVYGHDERFRRLVDFGSVISCYRFGDMLSTCMCDPNTTPPIFSSDMGRVYSIDTMTVPEIVELRNTFPEDEHLKSKIKNVLMRKVKHCLETDGVVIRNYVVGDSTCVLPYVLQGYDLSSPFNMEPFCIVRDYLLTFGPLITDDDMRAMYMYCIQDIVNMTKENRYEWFKMVKAVFTN